MQVDRMMRMLGKHRNSPITAWIGFLVLSLLVWKLVSDGDFSFIMVSPYYRIASFQLSLTHLACTAPLPHFCPPPKPFYKHTHRRTAPLRGRLASGCWRSKSGPRAPPRACPSRACSSMVWSSSSASPPSSPSRGTCPMTSKRGGSRPIDHVLSCVMRPIADRLTPHPTKTPQPPLLPKPKNGRSGDWFYHFVECLSLALVLFSMYLLKVRFPHSYDERSDSFGNMNGACALRHVAVACRSIAWGVAAGRAPTHHRA